MARIRSLKPEFWTSEQIAECSPNARLLFIGIWSFADDSGIHKASLKRLKMEVFPSDACDISTVGGWVEELIEAQLIEHYKIDPNAYWRVTGWSRHQRIDQPTYRHPLPDGSVPACVQRRSPAKDSSNIRRTLDDRSSRERSGEEWSKSKSPIGDSSKPVARVTHAPAIDDCPHEGVITLYHELLPTLRHVRDWTPARRKLLRGRWRSNSEYRSLDWWRGFFTYVSTSDFLLGRNTGQGDHTFEADLEWLIRPANFVKVVEGRYHSAEAA